MSAALPYHCSTLLLSQTLFRLWQTPAILAVPTWSRLPCSSAWTAI